MAKSKKAPSKKYADNRRARFDYHIVDTYVAGLELAGHEAKAIRTGNADLKGAYVTKKDDEYWLTNASIQKYKHASTITDYDDSRPRKLLLTKREMASLQAAKQNKMTIIPLSLFPAGRYIKLKIATARGKKNYDKRQTIKKREIERDSQKNVRR